jgi:hypothetical protein
VLRRKIVRNPSGVHASGKISAVNMSRTTRLAILYTLEVVAAVFALLIFLAALTLWRLAEGPVQAEILRNAAIEALLENADADIASIGEIEVSFDPRLAAIMVVAYDVAAARESGEIVINSDRIEAGLALDLLLVGRTAPVKLAVEGGQLSAVRDVQNQWHAGLGTLDAVRGYQTDIVENGVTDWSSPPQGSSVVLSRLREVDLRNVDLRVVDEITDFDAQMRDTRASVLLDGSAIEADISAGLLTSAGVAPIALRLISGTDFQSVFVDLRVRNLVLAAAAPRNGWASTLQSLDAPIDIDLVLDASTETGLRSALVEVQAHNGVLRLPHNEYAVRPSSLTLSLDTIAGEAVIETASIDSDLVDLQLAGKIFDFAQYDDALPSFARFELEGTNGFVNLGGVFPQPPNWQGFSLAGSVNRNERSIDLSQFEFQFNNARSQFSGRAWLSEVEQRALPNLRLSGPIEGVVSKSDVLGLWPVEFALGARDWVRDSILDGELSNADLMVDIPAQAIVNGALSNEHLRLSFDFEDADVRYMSTMTPLLGLSGSAVLYGDSLELQGSGGSIGDLQADTVFVEIPRFNPKGAIARFGGTGRGPVQDFLHLVDEPPLEIATDYGLIPEEFGGEGEIAFEIRRPMLRSVPPEDLGYDVTGSFRNVTAPTGVGTAILENGNADIRVSPEGFFAEAEAELVGAPTKLSWTETFGLEDDEHSSSVELSAVLSARALDRLGFPVRRFLDGAIGVETQISGRGFEFSGIDTRLDLTDAAVSLPANIWNKPAGEAAEARIVSGLGNEGGLKLDLAEIYGEGIEASLSAELAEDGRLLSAQILQLMVAGSMDLSAEAKRPDGPDGRLSLELDARFLDLSEGFSFGGPGNGGASNGNGFDFVSAPIEIDAMLDRVLIRDVVFEDVDMSARAGPLGLLDAEVIAQTQTGSFSLKFAPLDGDDEAPRTLEIETEDAGSVLMALTGFDNVTGGQLRLSGTTRPYGEAGPSSGSLDLGPFKLERMPLLARILAAGSFEGIASLLAGEQGVEFERLESRYAWQAGKLYMTDSRLAGPSLGITWSGDMDLTQSSIDIEGTILPSYGVNSVLGVLPVLGELLTSRRGEGVFGITYSAVGPFDETRITVNPLSAFAPGIFRRIFEGTSSVDQVDEIEAQLEQITSNETDDPSDAQDVNTDETQESSVTDAETADQSASDDPDAEPEQ